MMETNRDDPLAARPAENSPDSGLGLVVARIAVALVGSYRGSDKPWVTAAVFAKCEQK
jgi:hypothetical protein